MGREKQIPAGLSGAMRAKNYNAPVLDARRHTPVCRSPAGWPANFLRLRKTVY
jgi:hypothetical protein